MNGNTFLKLNERGLGCLADIPCLTMELFRTELISAVKNGNRAGAFFHQDGILYAVMISDADHAVFVTSTALDAGSSYPSLTPDAPAFHWFERELFEQSSIKPEGHPWLKPIRFTGEGAEPAVTDYFTMKGDSAHEVAVGPVHAGVIEPGHFRFQCMGEDVYSLEISLGYQHRGIEKMLTGGPRKNTLSIMETIAGDSSTAHAGAYCMLVEALAGLEENSAGTEVRRAIAWELERIANHTGDLGALAGDVAFLPTQSYCGRLRGDVLNMTAHLCGNRFGRGLMVPGGVGCAISQEHADEILNRMKAVEERLNDALDLMFDAPTVLDRFENTGSVSTETAAAIGVVGVAARASSLAQDIRNTHPYGAYRTCKTPVASAVGGDVMARAEIRRQEIRSSFALLNELLKELPPQDSGAKLMPGKTALRSNMIAVSLVEGWRGEICHTAITGADGTFARYKVVDPSFHNWFALAMALRGEQISNFPICNKSFNLSYCGHDL